jgi:hypothetical protein
MSGSKVAQRSACETCELTGHPVDGAVFQRSVVAASLFFPSPYFLVTMSLLENRRFPLPTPSRSKMSPGKPGWTISTKLSTKATEKVKRGLWEHRDVLTGQIAEVRALNVNANGAIRAGVFVRFHPSKSEQGLLLYSESLAGSTDPDESRPMMNRLKSSAGRRR